MTCRHVSLALVLCGLLAGCSTYYAARRDLGIDPQDSPPAQPALHTDAAMPPAMSSQAMSSSAGAMPSGHEGVSQANWAAQRAASLKAQDNTPPVGFKPEAQASAQLPAAPATAKAAPPSAPPAPGAPMPKPVAVQAPAMPAPAMPKPAAAPAPAMAAPTMPPPPAGLPAGYRPSPSAVDQSPAGQGASAAMPAPAMAAAAPAQGHAAAAPAAMKNGDAAMPHDIWRAHLASYRSEEEAIAGWESLLKASPKLYGVYDPQIVWTDIPNRGAYARLTMGAFADRKAAEAACETVRNPRRYCAPLKE